MATGLPELPTPQRRWFHFLPPLILAAAVGGIFWPMLGYEFDDFDTNEHVIDNPHIRGLTGENLVRILTTRCITSYYPVRTLSYALDYQLWGLNAGGFRVTNGLVHLANVLLVYWLILRLYRHPQFALPPPVDGRGILAVDGRRGAVCHPSSGGRTGRLGAWAGRTADDAGSPRLPALPHGRTPERGVPRTGRSKVLLHGCAAVCCAAACLSNAVGAVIPLLVTVWDVLLSRGFAGRSRQSSLRDGNSESGPRPGAAEGSIGWLDAVADRHTFA